MSVSIVAAPCRRFVHAARWNGHAPQTMTGAASVSDAHCQYVNWSAGIIAIAMTGIVSTAETMSRCRSAASSGSAVPLPPPSTSPASAASGRAGGSGRLAA